MTKRWRANNGTAADGGNALLYLTTQQLLEELRETAVLERLASGLASGTVEDLVVHIRHPRDRRATARALRSRVIVHEVVLARLLLRQLPLGALAQLLCLRGDDCEQRRLERPRLRLRERSGEAHRRKPCLVEDLVGQSVSDSRDGALVREEGLEPAGRGEEGAPKPLRGQLAA